MKKWFLTWIVGLAVMVVVFTWLVDDAYGHGPHHSSIKPAYDCFHNPDGPDTQGDVVVTHDMDLDVYTVWLCTCRHLDWVGWYCWWKKIKEYKGQKKAIMKMRDMTDGPRYGDEYLRRIRVSWFAKHGTDGCFIHHGKRYAVVVRRKG